MTGVQLTTLSTAIWVVATISLFILLARWSNGESWGLTASIVRGVRGWAEHDRPALTVISPFVDPLPALLVPKRPIGGAAAAPLPAAAEPPAVDRPPAAEIVDLGARRLPR